MAVITDTLETVLRLAGAAGYIQGLNQIAQAHQRLAQAQAAQARIQSQVQGLLAGGARFSPAMAVALAGAQAGVGAARGAVAGALGATALETVGLAATEAVQALAGYERELLRVQAFQKAAGQTVPTEQITEFTRQLSLGMGISQTEILRAQDYLARYGLTARQAEHDTEILARASQATGKSMEDLAQGIEMARRGHARELFRELGIPIKGVADQLYSFDQILRLVDIHTRSMAAGFGESLPGALGRMTAAWEDFKLQFGKLIEPAAVAELKAFTQLVNMFAADMKALSEHRFADFFFGRAAFDALHPKPGAQGGGAGGESATERYLRKIEYNTGPQGALGRATRGGGSFAEPGGGLRIRDFNQMFRHSA